jgi:hypothetical protein
MMTLPRRLTRGLIYALCAFLLFAQQAALTHAVSHATANAAGSQQGADAYEDERTRAPELVSLCAFDVSFGQLLGSGPASAHAVFAAAVGAGTATEQSRTRSAADALTPRSRGPPVLL